MQNFFFFCLPMRALNEIGTTTEISSAGSDVSFENERKRCEIERKRETEQWRDCGLKKKLIEFEVWSDFIIRSAQNIEQSQNSQKNINSGRMSWHQFSIMAKRLPTAEMTVIFLMLWRGSCARDSNHAKGVHLLGVHMVLHGAMTCVP